MYDIIMTSTYPLSGYYKSIATYTEISKARIELNNFIFNTNQNPDNIINTYYCILNTNTNQIDPKSIYKDDIINEKKQYCIRVFNPHY